MNRGCGKRVVGGVYATTQVGRAGYPLDTFLLDPPVPVDAHALGLSPIGVSLMPDTKGTYHIWDWIGEQHYALPIDFIEETRVMGLSRRLPRTLDYSKLSVGSRIICLHPRAFIVNAKEFYDMMKWGPGTCECKLHKPNHELPGYPRSAKSPNDLEMCISLLWCDVPERLVGANDYVKNAAGVDTFMGLNAVRRTTKSQPTGGAPLSFTCAERPPVADEHALAAFLSMPITRLEVVADPVAQSHLDALKKAGVSSIQVDLVNE